MIIKEQKKGHIHPITQLLAESILIFKDLGFDVVEGPEIETEYYNFDALNTLHSHPARDMQDTFWIKPRNKNLLLRSQVSAIQVRYMEKHKPPFKIICAGRVFRNEATDATHEAQFYQLEGLAVSRDMSLANLKGIIHHFFQNLFGKKVEIRFRPSYFPFVEPGVEVDVSCFKCVGKGCSMCKGTGWIEVMGAGMVHPEVFKSAKVDSKKWKGLAFGMGFDRLVMLKYGIEDIRLLYSGDLRFIKQF